MNNELIRTSTFETCPIREAYTEGEYILADYYPQIMRIIGSEAKAFVRSCNFHGDKFTVEGVAEITVLYLSDKGELNSSVHMLPFTHTHDSDFTAETVYEVSASVSYLNTRALSPQKLYLKATVEIQTSYVKTEEFKTYAPKNSDGIFVRQTESETFRITCAGHKPLKITDEISQDHGDIKVLKYRVSFNETEQKILTGKLITKADMTIGFLCSAADGSIFTHEQKTSVSQILEMDGLTEGTVCDVKYKLCDQKIAVNSDEANGKIVYEFTVNVDAVGYEPCRYTLCKDAFSGKHKLIHKFFPFRNCVFSKISKDHSFRESFDTGFYDKIYDISVHPTVLSTDFDEETYMLSVTGTFSCKAVFTDENGEFSSAEKEIPFTLPIQTECPAEGIKTSAEMQIVSFAYVENDSRSVELRMDCRYKGFMFTEKEVPVITEVEEGEGTEPRSKDILTLYYGEENESIWDISKKYGVDPRILMKNNGISCDVLESNTLLKIQGE